MKPIRPTITGYWNMIGFPAEVRVEVNAINRLFKIARWKQDYPGVVAQYREDVPQNSMHLFVRGDGTFEIDHLDDDNPDRGRVIEHALNDTVAGPILVGTALLGGVLLLARAVSSLSDS